MIIREYLLVLILFSYAAFSEAQVKISFTSEDGLTVTADQYLVSDTLPWILMFHQSGSSRGEYREIAPKLNRLGYNGLAVDLRYGKEIRFIVNETNLAAQIGKYPISMKEAGKDIRAAINWVNENSDKPFVLFGSSYSASLSMFMALESPNTKAVIAFSPGEFFGGQDIVRNRVGTLDVPLFIGSTKRELPYVSELSSEINNDIKIIFSPSVYPGRHGARTLWETEESHEECWLALIMFFKLITR